MKPIINLSSATSRVLWHHRRKIAQQVHAPCLGAIPAVGDVSALVEPEVEREPGVVMYIGIFEDLQTTIDNLGRVLGKASASLPHVNVSTYDEPIPERLREGFYADYPLLKKVYDLAVDTYRLEGYSFPGEGMPAIPPDATGVIESG